MQKKLKKLVLFLNLALVGMTGMSSLAPTIHPGSNIFFAFAGLIFPWLMGLNFFFLFLWLLFEQKWAIPSLLILVLSWPGIKKYISLKQSSHGEVTRELVISSFNLQHGYDIREKDKKGQDKTERFKKFLSQTLTTDIFCAQEVSYFIHQLIIGTNLYPYFHRIEGKGAGIYTKYPIIDSGQIDFNTKTNSCLWADIKTPDCIFRIYSFHLQSNNIGKDAEKVIDEGDLQDSETWTGVKNILGKYKRSTRIRTSQAERIQDHIKTSPHPVILCGDLNEPPQSYVYHTISSGMSDSFLKRGFGFGTSFAGRIPTLRIDYIFADSNFEINEHRVFKHRFSDHYPIRAIIKCTDH